MDIKCAYSHTDRQDQVLSCKRSLNFLVWKHYFALPPTPQPLSLSNCSAQITIICILFFNNKYKKLIANLFNHTIGKTHTMTGDFEGKMRGIIPRSVEQIIENVLQMRGNGWDIVVTMSMVSEIISTLTLIVVFAITILFLV